MRSLERNYAFAKRLEVFSEKWGIPVWEIADIVQALRFVVKEVA